MSVPSRIGLSTASVYPESSAHAFGYAAGLGYDAVEVMVGIDSLSQQTSAVKQLADHHEIEICAIHAPCLLFTQRVWGTEPWGKLERSAEMAEAVGAAVVVVHPPFRWQKEYAANFVNGIAAMSASGGYGPCRVAEGIVGGGDLTVGARVRELLEAEVRAAGGRL